MEDVNIAANLQAAEEMVEIPAEDKVEIESAKYENMTKAELVELAYTLRDVNLKYEEDINIMRQTFDKQLSEVNNHYKGALHMKDLQLGYKDRKFKMIQDIIKLEGEE